MYGLYIDDVKGTCSPITNTTCFKYKEKIMLFLAWKAGMLQCPFDTASALSVIDPGFGS